MFFSAVSFGYDVYFVHKLTVFSETIVVISNHKPYKENNVIIRSAKEQDYLWNGIWVSFVANGWVKNVTFENLTQGIIVSHSADSTFKNLTFLGKEGHAGITIGRSNDILVSEVDFFAPLVHPVTLTTCEASMFVQVEICRYCPTEECEIYFGILSPRKK